MHVRAWRDRKILEISPGPDPNFSDTGNYITIPVGQVDALIATLQQAKEFVIGPYIPYNSFKVEEAE